MNTPAPIPTPSGDVTPGAISFTVAPREQPAHEANVQERFSVHRPLGASLLTALLTDRPRRSRRSHF
jgi:hypothetical protein